VHGVIRLEHHGWTGWTNIRRMSAKVAAGEFVAKTLDRLATADPELRATVGPFIRE